MPSRKDCIDELAQKAGRTKKETEDFLDAIDAKAEDYQADGMDAGLAYQRARDEELANLSEQAAVRRRAAIMDRIKDAQRSRDYGNAEREIEALKVSKKIKQSSTRLALEGKLVGTNMPIEGARRSVDAGYVVRAERLSGGFEHDLEKAGLEKVFASRAIEDKITDELFELNKKPSAAWERAKTGGAPYEQDLFELGLRGQGPGNPGITKDAQALTIAKIIQKWQRTSMEAINREGGWVRSYSGYITRTSHDPDKIAAAGQEKWIGDTIPKLDLVRTFGTKDVQRARDALRAMFRPMAQGDHFDHGRPIDEPLYPTPAKTASASRELHFKSGKDWRDYNKDYGVTNPTHTIVQALYTAARRAALMHEFGTEPRKAYEADKEMLKGKLQARVDTLSATLSKKEEAYRSAAAGSAEAKKLAGEMEDLRGKIAEGNARYKDFAEKWSVALDNRFAQIDGTSQRPVSRTKANIVAGIMSVQRMSKLGNIFMTHLSSLPTKAAEARYWGIPLSERYASLFRGFTRGAEGSVKRTIGDSLLVGAEHRLGMIMNRYDVADAPAGALHKMEERFFRWTRVNGVIDNQRSEFQAMAAAHMGSKRGQDLAAIGRDERRVLSLYGIGDKEWKLYHGVEWTKPGDGRTYLLPSDLMNLTDDQVGAYLKDRGGVAQRAPTAEDIKQGREDLALQLATAYSDRSGYAIPMPSARTRAVLFGKNYEPGSGLNMALKLFWQFKQWPADMIMRAWGREMYGRAGDGKWGRVAGLAETVVGGIVFGVLGEAIRDVIKGEDPLAKLRNHPFAAVMAGAQRSGMGSIVGDYLLGQFDRHGLSAAANLLGPTFGQVDNLADLLHAGEETKQGTFSKAAWRERGADLLKIVKDNTPFMNFWLTHLATDALIWHRLQEWISPGYLKRSEDRQRQLQGTQFMISPAKTDRWITSGL